MINIDESETAKFSALADEWWDSNGPLSTLHDINPVRLNYIKQAVDLAGKHVLDVGCGGGILSESLCKESAVVTGIDASQEAINIARLHSDTANLKINYVESSAERHAQQNPEAYDVITCMELLEHVPDPESLLAACADMLKPGGHLFASTINRNLKSYLGTVLAAEYLLKLIPRGTHDYARFIKPAELAEWCRKSGLTVLDISGMAYLPFVHSAWLKRNPDMNYLLHATR